MMAKTTAAISISRKAARLESFAGVIACLLTLISMMIVAVVVAMSLYQGEETTQFLPVDFLGGASGLDSFFVILGRNISVAALLYSGVVTAGVSSIVGIPLIAFSIGGFAAAVAAEHGWSALVASVWMYVPFEFAGIVIAGGAGLLPLLAVVIPWLQTGTGPVERYICGVGRTLRMALLAFALLIIGAIIEAVVIATR